MFIELKKMVNTVYGKSRMSDHPYDPDHQETYDDKIKADMIFVRGYGYIHKSDLEDFLNPEIEEEE